MKKFILIAVFLIAGFTVVYAQTGFLAGAKLGAEFGFSKASGDIKKWADALSVSYDEKSQAAFTLGFYGGFGITNKLAVLAEMDLYFGQGIRLDFSAADYKVRYSSLDIPILLRYAFVQSKVSFGLLAGPYFSFPLSAKKDYSGSGSTWTGTNAFDTGGMTTGALGGLFLSYSTGRGRIMADLRLLFDFTPLKDADDAEILNRRGVVLTVGYEFSFGGK
ncbi:MAG: PorT family protein [Treponema sp.]|nr:PorT family protein [Treponema sp.]